MFHFVNQQSSDSDFSTFEEDIASMLQYLPQEISLPQEILPLHAACANGDLKMVKLLLDQGININAFAPRKLTPLYCAVDQNQLNIVKYLVQRGADINATDDDGWSPLAYACEGNNFSMVNYLVENGADVNIKSKRLDSLLHIASNKGNVKLIDYLINKGLSVNDVNRLDTKPIHKACIKGHYKAVETLVRNSSDFKTGCKSISDKGEIVDRNVTPLCIAASKGHLDLVKYFIELKVDVNTKTWQESTALQAACQEGEIEIVKVLLQNHADINAGNINNVTPLHFAVLGNNVNVVACLLKHPKVEINVKTLNGLTPLHIAVLKGHFEIVKLLVENGADIDLTDIDGDTPSSLALKANQVEIFSYLSNFKKVNKTSTDVNSTPDGIMFKAVNDNDITNLQRAINKGANVNTKSNKGNTPLVIASWKGFDDIIQILIQHNADVNLTGKNNCSALHYAAKYNHIGIVHYLLQHGAIYNIPTSKENKIPNDFAHQDSQVFLLLKLVDECFKNVTEGNKDITKKLPEMKSNNLNDYKSVTKACNTDGRTLTQLNNDLLKKHNNIAKSFAKLSIQGDYNGFL